MCRINDQKWSKMINTEGNCSIAAFSLYNTNCSRLETFQVINTITSLTKWADVNSLDPCVTWLSSTIWRLLCEWRTIFSNECAYFFYVCLHRMFVQRSHRGATADPGGVALPPAQRCTRAAQSDCFQRSRPPAGEFARILRWCLEDSGFHWRRLCIASAWRTRKRTSVTSCLNEIISIKFK